MGNRGRVFIFGTACLALASLLMTVSCATAPEKDYVPRNSEEGYIIQTVSSIVDALNSGDVSRLMAKVSTGYYRGYNKLEERLRAILGGRPGFNLSAEVKAISIDEAKVTVAVIWKSKWRGAAPNSTESDEGSVDLIFMKAKGLKLIDQSTERFMGL